MHFITPSLPALVILMLAHMRVARLVILDTFPPVAKARDWFFLRFPPEDSIYTRMVKEDGHWVVATDGRDGLPIPVREDSIIGELFACRWCIPFWLGIVQTLVYVANPTLCLALCLPFAMSMFTGGMWNRMTG